MSNSLPITADSTLRPIHARQHASLSARCVCRSIWDASMRWLCCFSPQELAISLLGRLLFLPASRFRLRLFWRGCASAGEGQAIDACALFSRRRPSRCSFLSASWLTRAFCCRASARCRCGIRRSFRYCSWRRRHHAASRSRCFRRMSQMWRDHSIERFRSLQNATRPLLR